MICFVILWDPFCNKSMCVFLVYIIFTFIVVSTVCFAFLPFIFFTTLSIFIFFLSTLLDGYVLLLSNVTRVWHKRILQNESCILTIRVVFNTNSAFLLYYLLSAYHDVWLNIIQHSQIQQHADVLKYIMLDSPLKCDRQLTIYQEAEFARCLNYDTLHLIWKSTLVSIGSSEQASFSEISIVFNRTSILFSDTVTLRHWLPRARLL